MMLASPESYPPYHCTICAEQQFQTGTFNHCEDKSTWIRGERNIKKYFGGCTDDCPPDCSSLHTACPHLKTCLNDQCDCQWFIHNDKELSDKQLSEKYRINRIVSEHSCQVYHCDICKYKEADAMWYKFSDLKKHKQYYHKQEQFI